MRYWSIKGFHRVLCTSTHLRQQSIPMKGHACFVCLLRHWYIVDIQHLPTYAKHTRPAEICSGRDVHAFELYRVLAHCKCRVSVSSTSRANAAKADQCVLQLSLNVGLHSRHNITLEALPDSSSMGSASLPMQKLELLWRVGVAHHGGTQDKRDRGQVDVYSSGRQGVRVRPQG